MIKFIQSTQFINKDMHMFHRETQTPALARTSNLNEELGQVGAHCCDGLTAAWGSLLCGVTAVLGSLLYGVPASWGSLLGCSLLGCLLGLWGCRWSTYSRTRRVR